MKIKLLLVYAFFVLTLAPLSAKEPAVYTYGKVGVWQVIYTEKTCYALPMEFSKPSIAFMRSKKESLVIVNLASYGNWIKNGQEYFVNFILGKKDLDFFGTAEGKIGTRKTGNLGFTFFPDKYYDNFAKSSEVQIVVKNAPKVPKISLSGSDKMLKLFRKCVADNL